VQPSGLLREDLPEPLRPQPQRFRPEVRELLLDRLGREQPDAGALLRASLGQDELGAAFEPQPEGRSLRAGLARSEVATSGG